MNQVRCPNCGNISRKFGKTKAGTQRWHCSSCSTSFTKPLDTSSSDLEHFLAWLLGKQAQSNMPGHGRSFRRRTSQFWQIWPLPPKIEEAREVVFVDGIYIAKNACILICCDERHVLGWYVCRYEHSKAWEALMSRIATPYMVISDGGTGFHKAVKHIWKDVRVQRCTFHAFSQVRRYTTTRPRTLAGIELYCLARDLLHIHNTEEAANWVERLAVWKSKHRVFLSEMTKDEFGRVKPTHERLLKAEASLVKLVAKNTLFTYLDSKEGADREYPSTNNRIEGAVNAQLRAMLRAHRGMSVERRIKAVFWWCYQHSPKPLSAAELLNVMPTDSSIAKLYERMNSRARLEDSIPMWGDAIVWSEFHHFDLDFKTPWD